MVDAVEDVIVATYNSRLVLLSIATAMIASYTALDLARRVTATQGKARYAWLIGSAIALGMGLWSTHFVGMLAYNLSVPVIYDLWLVLGSMMVAIGVFGVALFRLSDQTVNQRQLLLIGSFMGLGIAAMHYLGMAAMQLQAVMHHDLIWVALSIAVAIGASLISIGLVLQLRSATTWMGCLLKISSAGVMGIAFSGMHYTAMAGVQFTLIPQLPSRTTPSLDSALLTDALGVAGLVILTLMLIASLVDQRFQIELARTEALHQSEQRFQSLVQNASDITVISDVDGTIRYVSLSVKQILGYEPAEWQEQGWSRVHPDDVERVKHCFTDSLSSPSVNLVTEVRLQHTNGSWREFELIINNLIAEPNVEGIVTTCRDITERKRSIERERLAAAIAQRIRQSLKLDDILNTAVAEVRHLLQADRVLIYRLEPAYGGRVTTEAVAPDCAAIFEQPLPDNIFPNKMRLPYQQGRVRTIADIEQGELPACLVETLKQLEVRAEMIVPILCQTSLWGLLIAHQCQMTRDWQDWEVELLKQLASQLAIAIQQAHLYEETQHQVQREQALNRFTQAIRSSLNLECIFATAAEEVAQLLQIDRVKIMQYLPEHHVWRSVGDYHLRSNLSSALGLEVPDDNNPLSEQLKQLQVVRIHDTQTLKDSINQDLAKTFPGAWLLVPLHFHGTLWGSLSLSMEGSAHYWHDTEVELVCAFAAQLAIAIQQSVLFGQVQRLNATLESQVQDRTIQLRKALTFEALLKRITDKVRDSLDESHILQTAVQELGAELDVDCCDTGIYSLDTYISTITHEYTVALPSAQGSIVLMTEAPGVHDQLLQGNWLQFCVVVPSLARPDTAHFTVFACPLADEQGILGDLWVFRQREEIFDDLEVRLIQQVANQCAIALRQARLHQAVQTQVEELQKLHGLKDEFLSTVSHELRAPMANIKMAIQMLTVVLNQPGTSDSNHKVPRYLQILKDECERETNLINDLLDLQRLDAGVQPLNLTTIDLQLWLPHIIEPFQERARSRQQILQLHIPSDLPPVQSDPASLERIVAELLNNACKYTPPEHMIRVTAQTQSNMLLLAVANSGVEIPADELPRIFEKFYRVLSTDPYKQGGTGLGLALLQKLTAHLGGTLSVNSAEGETRFTVKVPIHLSVHSR